MNVQLKLILEWLFWCLLVFVFWMQTDAFSEPISEFRFGADGWPKVVLLGLIIGATGQMALGLYETKTHADSNEGPTEPTRQISRWQQLAIFTLPLVYIWFMHRIGFFVATPLFIAVYLWVLEVRRVRPLVVVTAVICVLVILIFVRFFYVALPVGSWPLFYDINNYLITVVRMGV